MNKHRKGLYIISGLFYLFFSGALALYPTKMTVGATISMIAGAVLTLAAAVSSFILAAQSGKNQIFLVFTWFQHPLQSIKKFFNTSVGVYPIIPIQYSQSARVQRH